MFAMITTEEYQELILAKEERDRLLEELTHSDRCLTATHNEVKDLLLMLTNGHTVPKYGETFECYDIVDDVEIAKFINENYVTKGLMKFTKTKGERK